MSLSNAPSAQPATLGERALILSGGGSLGNAWLIGFVAGLFEAGLDVTKADLTIGTSAGSTAAVQVTSVSPPKLFADILSATPAPRVRPVAPSAERTSLQPVINHLERTNAIIASAKDAADMRRRMGAAALEMDAASDGSGQTHWRIITAARLPRQDWPKQAVLITAVDASNGEPVMFDRNSGVDLVDAVAASTSSGAPYAIGANRYIDGGYRRNENADLAAGYKRVLVLSPFSGRTRHPLEWGMQLAAQVDELRAGGSSVVTIFPNDATRDIFGDNMMDMSKYLLAAQAGHDQGSSLAEQLTPFWR